MSGGVLEWLRAGGPFGYAVVLCALVGIVVGLVRGVMVGVTRWRVPAALVWAPAAACVGLGILGQLFGVVELFEALAHASPDMREELMMYGYALAHSARVLGFMGGAAVLAWGALLGGIGLALSAREGNTRTGVESALVLVAGGLGVGAVMFVWGGIELGGLLGFVLVLGASVLGSTGASANGSDAPEEAARLAVGRAATWWMGVGATASAVAGLWALNQMGAMEAFKLSDKHMVGVLVQAATDAEAGLWAVAGAAGGAWVAIGAVLAARHAQHLGQPRAWAGAAAVALICAACATPQLALASQLNTIQGAIRELAGAQEGGPERPKAVDLDGRPVFAPWGAPGCAVTPRAQGWEGCWSKSDRVEPPPFEWAEANVVFDVSAKTPAQRLARHGWFKGRGDLSVMVPGPDVEVIPYAPPSSVATVAMEWVMPPGHPHEDALRGSKGAQVAALRGQSVYTHADAIPHAVVEREGQAWWVAPGEDPKALGPLGEHPALASMARGAGAVPERVLVVVGEGWTAQDLVSVCLTLQAVGPSCVLAQEAPEAFLGRRGLTLK